jgi:hypothetical protein
MEIWRLTKNNPAHHKMMELSDKRIHFFARKLQIYTIHASSKEAEDAWLLV